MSRIPGAFSDSTARLPGPLPSDGIAQATYDAVVAARDAALAAQAAAEAKLVVTSAWVDLTAAITTACAGAAANDPDSLAAGLTVSTSSGTFDGASIPCNLFGWTTHSTINDGHGETLNYDLGTVLSHLSGYNPATHGVQIEACLVATGTLNGALPRLSVIVVKNGALGFGMAPASGFAISSGTTVSGVAGAAQTGANETGSVDPTGLSVRCQARFMAHGGNVARTLNIVTLNVTSTNPNLAINGTDTYTTSDKLYLCLGQGSTAAAAVSGIKIRFRVRTFLIANLNLTATDLGVQA